MDPEKVAFLFGNLPEGLDPDDARQLADHFTLAPPVDAAALPGTLHAIIANQISAEDPPEVWHHARRLLAMGLDRDSAMRQLALVLGEKLLSRPQADQSFDTAGYVEALAELPVPAVEEVEEATVATVRERQPIPCSELDLLVAARFGRDPDSPVMRNLLDRTQNRLVDEGVIEFLTEDRVVHVGDLTSGLVLTHRLTEVEIADGLIAAGVDLALFNRYQELGLYGETVEVTGAPGGEHWWFPDGWLERFPAGALIAVSLPEDGEVLVTEMEAEPADDRSLVQRFREAYDRVVAEPDVPALVTDILYELLADDSALFRTPTLPLSELCAAAGLEVKGRFAAHEERLWENQRQLHLWKRAWEAFDGEEERYLAALRILDLAREEAPGRADLKRALKDLDDEDLAGFVAGELAAVETAEGEVSPGQHFAAALVRVAGVGKPKAVAHWFAAQVAERDGDLVVADAHLSAGLASGAEYDPLLTRAAWYASDRGDADGAIGLLRRTRSPSLATLRLLSDLPGGNLPNLGRNEPCWCGSGRKFKQCHMNQAAGPPPLPDRVGWLCRKAVWFLEHRAPEALEQVIELAALRAEDPDDDDSVLDALQDPLLMDLVLHEGGWFVEFLEERGPLLPDDEVLLAQSWTLVDRSVHVIEEVRPGAGCLVRDLATGERLEVRERTFTQMSHAGSMICARVVPDGETHQFLGGLFPVAPGTEEQVLDLCAERDIDGLVEWVGRLYRPPVLATREGQSMVRCTAVWEVPDPAAAREALDEGFGAEGDDLWVETLELAENDSIIRAWLRLEGSRLTVETLSEQRMERVLEFLRSRVAGGLLSDERKPVDPSGGIPSPEAPGDRSSELTAEELAEVMPQVQQQMEDRWLREPVPALAGLTPREAAADPTRREQLERLLASFEEMNPPAGAFTFRTARLRAELGMDKGPD